MMLRPLSVSLALGVILLEKYGTKSQIPVEKMWRKKWAWLKSRLFIERDKLSIHCYVYRIGRMAEKFDGDGNTRFVENCELILKVKV